MSKKCVAKIIFTPLLCLLHSMDFPTSGANPKIQSNLKSVICYFFSFKFSPNTSFSIHTSSPDTTFSGNNNNYVTKKKPIWNSSTRFSGIVHDDVSVNTRHWKSKQNLYQGLEKNNDSDPTIRDWKNKKNRVKGLQTIMMNGTANKDEKVNGRPRSDSIPGLKIYSIWSQKLAKDQVNTL